VSKIIKAHFYIVKGKLKDKVGFSYTMGWMFHSFHPIEEFAPRVADLIPEYDLDIMETEFGESQIMETWEIK
jgi:hypothetical protein